GLLHRILQRFLWPDQNVHSSLASSVWPRSALSCPSTHRRRESAISPPAPFSVMPADCEPARFGKRIREITLEFPEVQFNSAQAGRNDSGTDPFPPSRLEIMIGPTPREE